jgi:hypothetical protein
MHGRSAVAFAAIVTFIGCSGAPDREATAQDGPHAPTAAPAPSGATALDEAQDPGIGAPSDQFSSRAAPRTGNQAQLVEGVLPAARPTACVEMDAAGDVTRMDEFACTTAASFHECTPSDCPWIECGGCLLRVGNADNGRMTLSARLGLGGCEAFAGVYELDPDIACR